PVGPLRRSRLMPRGGYVRPAAPLMADTDLAIFLISRCWASVNTGGRPPAYLGNSEAKPSALKLCSTSRTRSSLVKASPATCPPPTPCPAHGPTGARRHVPPDPYPRRTIRFRAGGRRTSVR